MDESTTLKELIDYVEDFRAKRGWHRHHDAKELTIAMSIEVSELLEHFRYMTRDNVKKFLEKPENKEEAANELADVLYHVLVIAKEMDVDLSEAFKRKMKLTEKKYPIEKCFGLNKKYTEYAEK